MSSFFSLNVFIMQPILQVINRSILGGASPSRWENKTILISLFSLS